MYNDFEDTVKNNTTKLCKKSELF